MRYFDLHCDTLYKGLFENKELFDGDMHISLKKGSVYRPWIQCFAIWTPDKYRGETAIDLFERTKKRLELELSLNADRVLQCRDSGDIDKAIEIGLPGLILTVEGGAAIAGDIERLDYLHGCGVRMMTLTWNGTCELGDGTWAKEGGGLTQFGRDAVRRMNELGIIVDISHASDRLFYDTLEISTRPIVASHSNSRSICNHRRNLTDEQFCAIVDSAGLVGLNFFNEILKEDKCPNMYDILRHAERFLSLGGAKVICLGSDFDGADLPEGMLGVESVADLYELFLKNNYPQKLVDDIFFFNAYNFFKENI